MSSNQYFDAPSSLLLLTNFLFVFDMCPFVKLTS